MTNDRQHDCYHPVAGRNKAKLAELSAHTKRKQSLLGAEAISAYVARELSIVEAIECGRADVQAGRYVSNEQAFRQVDEIIGAAKAKR